EVGRARSRQRLMNLQLSHPLRATINLQRAAGVDVRARGDSRKEGHSTAVCDIDRESVSPGAARRSRQHRRRNEGDVRYRGEAIKFLNAWVGARQVRKVKLYGLIIDRAAETDMARDIIQFLPSHQVAAAPRVGVAFILPLQVN